MRGERPTRTVDNHRSRPRGPLQARNMYLSSRICRGFQDACVLFESLNWAQETHDHSLTRIQSVLNQKITRELAAFPSLADKYAASGLKSEIELERGVSMNSKGAEAVST